jgi:Domain of Unknown Function (DUF1080)
MLMCRRLFMAGSLVVTAAVLVAGLQAGQQQWKIHDRSRPAPPAVTPGECSTQAHAGAAPSDAMVLFDGKDLSKWKAADGGPAKWKVGDGYFEVAPGTEDMYTRDTFGDAQLHLEWATPDPPRGEDQDRGNSGFFLMGLYELQVLDSYHSKTYADGQAGAIYGQYPPLVNACCPPGQWQAYDVVFHGPRFDKDGKLARPAFITVLHNGVLVQDHARIMGPTEHMKRPPYHVTPDKLPIKLQDHNHPVRYRNIWVRELAENQ